MIGSNFTQSFVVTRMSSNGSYVNGYYVEGSAKTFSVRGSVQPLSGKDLQVLSEGDRQKDIVRMYVEKQLNMTEEGTLKRSDFIKINGKQYQVMTVEDWTLHSLGPKHYKVLLVRSATNEEQSMVVP